MMIDLGSYRVHHVISINKQILEINVRTNFHANYFRRYLIFFLDLLKKPKDLICFNFFERRTIPKTRKFIYNTFAYLII
jgi:hypothetical protein